jgi:hypothetical protein
VSPIWRMRNGEAPHTTLGKLQYTQEAWTGLPPNISLDGTGDAGRFWSSRCKIGMGLEKRH